MSSWTPRRVLEAAAASQWCPDGAIEVLTDDYRLIRYPDWALDPAFPAAQVTWSRSERTAAERKLLLAVAEIGGKTILQTRGDQFVSGQRNVRTAHDSSSPCSCFS